jgi:NhaA family Na+:H+ antiporter
MALAIIDDRQPLAQLFSDRFLRPQVEAALALLIAEPHAAVFVRTFDVERGELFGFASAGVTIPGIEAVLDPLPLGIALGLFLGKQVGVFGAVWLADKTGIAPKPTHLRWTHIYGAALLCGVGFTMSLFIGALAFTEPLLVDEAKIGTLAGSLLSGVLGFAVLRLFKPIPSTSFDDEEAREVFGEDAEEDPAVCR